MMGLTFGEIRMQEGEQDVSRAGDLVYLDGFFLEKSVTSFQGNLRGGVRDQLNLKQVNGIDLRKLKCLDNSGSHIKFNHRWFEIDLNFRELYNSMNYEHSLTIF